MIRLDIYHVPFLILIPAVLQVIICIFTKKNRFLIGLFPLALLIPAMYGFVSDRMGLPYPRLFAPDFMLSSALAGFIAFGFMFIGAVLGTVLWAAVIGAVKIFRSEK